MAAGDGKKSPEAKKSKNGIIIKLLVLLIVIAIIAYLYEIYGQLPIALLASSKPLNAQTFEAVALQKLQSEKIETNYTGSITVGSDPAVYFRFLDFLGSYYYYMNASNLPGLGSPTIILGPDPNDSQYDLLCVQGSPALEAFANRTSNGQSTGNFGCLATTVANATANFWILNSFVNFLGFTNVSSQSFGLSSVHGYPCYSSSGTGSAEVNSTLLGSTGQFYTPTSMSYTTCFSSQYYVPLTLNATFKAQNGTVLNVNFVTTGLIINPNFNVSVIN